MSRDEALPEVIEFIEDASVAILDVNQASLEGSHCELFVEGTDEDGSNSVNMS